MEVARGGGNDRQQPQRMRGRWWLGRAAQASLLSVFIPKLSQLMSLAFCLPFLLFRCLKLFPLYQPLFFRRSSVSFFPCSFFLSFALTLSNTQPQPSPASHLRLLFVFAPFSLLLDPNSSSVFFIQGRNPLLSSPDFSSPAFYPFPLFFFVPPCL